MNGVAWLPELNETANYVLPIPLKTTPEPTLRERAVLLALEKGEVRTKDGTPRCYLVRMREEGLLVKAAYGRYRAVVPKAA